MWPPVSRAVLFSVGRGLPDAPLRQKGSGSPNPADKLHYFITFSPRGQDRRAPAVFCSGQGIFSIPPQPLRPKTFPGLLRTWGPEEIRTFSASFEDNNILCRLLFYAPIY